MHTLTVGRTINAPIGTVFDAFTDHEALSQVHGVRSCRLTSTGTTERNGLGAVRVLDCGAVRLTEEITGFDRPHRMEYRIRSSVPHADHELGRVDFTDTAAGTTITWTTVFGLRPPALGRVLDPIFAVAFGIAFRLVLRNVERRVRASRQED